MKKICSIYHSKKKEGLYLYVEKQEGLARVPEALLEQFGKPEKAMTLLLRPERELARVDVANVLKALDEQGYFLQMPPVESSYMQAVHQKNDKFGG